MDVAVELKMIHTIPIYNGMTPEQSWATIVLADGEGVDPDLAKGKLEGWANIGIWENSQGESFAAPLSMDHDEAMGLIDGPDGSQMHVYFDRAEPDAGDDIGV